MTYRDFIQFDPGAVPDACRPRDAAALIARKTPEQQALVLEHLRRFPGLAGERLEELAALFPFHPDVLALLEKIPFIAPPAWTRILAAAVGRLSGELPVDRPGFLAADDLWPLIRADKDLNQGSEIEAVVYCGGQLEKKAAKKLPAGAGRDLALRLARVLALHRLASPDIYGPGGADIDELAALLCLHPADAAARESLRAEIQAAIQQLQQVGGPHGLETDAPTGRPVLLIKKFKRFVPPEIALHWVNAIPFLILMGTGGAMLAGHFFHVRRDLLSWLSLAHRLSAATWLLVLPPTVMVRLNVHWTHIRTALTWSRGDLLWMIQSARVAYNKNASLPPAGNLNSGQKMNAMLVLMYFFGFGGTGLLMFFEKTILVPWYLHTALFFSAVGSVSGHMFLALINPSTRVALPGIFHGWVPLKYVAHHHPLSLPHSLRTHGQAHESGRKTLLQELSLTRIEIAAAVVAVVLGGIGLVVGVRAVGLARLAAAREQFSREFAATISPAQLSTKHRAGPPSESCTQCHDYTGQIPNAKCEACHANIKERRAKGIGYHGTLTQDCRSCHREHRDGQALLPLDRKQFNHDLAAFKLAGKHTGVECDSCHRQERPKTNGIYFTGLKFAACTDCHKDIHDGQLAAACETCHTPAGWQRPNLKFSHATNSVFKLEGKHQALDCAKCHQPRDAKGTLGSARFKGLPMACTGCHQDPHLPPFDKTCTACHTPAGWDKKALLFSHDRDTRFPLLAKHAAAACTDCHKPSTPGGKLAAAPMHGLKTACVDCHPDPHRGQFKTDCQRCHPTPESWKGKSLHFEHNRDAQFKLVGRHLSVECLKCHKPADGKGTLAAAEFTSLKTGCQDCHAVKHPAEYGQTCVSCHAVTQWNKKRPAADHPSAHELNDELLLGKHITTRCDSCHNAQKIPTLGFLGAAKFDCATCHDPQAKPHQGTLGANCAKCHNTDNWKDSLRFNHDTMTRWPLTQDHRHVACAKCHKDNHWKPVDTSCASCHPKFKNNDPAKK